MNVPLNLNNMLMILKKNIFTVSLVLTQLLCSAQELTLRLADGQLTQLGLETLNILKEGDPYTLRFEGVNLHVYKITINGKDTTVSKKLDSPSFSSFALDGLKSLVEGIDIGGVIVSQIATTNGLSAFKDFDFGESVLDGGYKVFYQYEGQPTQEYVVDYLKFYTPDTDSVKIRIASEKKILGVFTNSLSEVKDQIDEISFQIYEAQLNSRKTRNAVIDQNIFSNTFLEVKKIRTQLDKIQKSLKASAKNYTSYSLNWKKVIEEAKLIQSDAEIIKSYKGLSNKLEEAKKIVSASEIKKNLDVLIELENLFHDDFQYSTFGQLIKERKEVNISITPWDSISRMPSYSTIISFPLQQKKYAGVGPSFYLSGLYDQAFSSIEDTSGVFQFTEESVTKLEVGTAILLRIGRKWKNNFGGHLTFGPGISLSEKIRPRILIGGGVTIGGTHSFVLDVGGVGGFVDRKSNAVVLDDPVYKESFDPVHSKLDFSWFVSIGYLYKF